MSTIFTSSSQCDLPLLHESGFHRFAPDSSGSKHLIDFVPGFDKVLGEAMIDNLLLRQFDGNLSVMLRRELNAGNSIAEVWSGWPHRESIFVILASPFKAQHSDLPQGISFKEINDPQFWKSEYYDGVSHHCLACRF